MAAGRVAQGNHRWSSARRWRWRRRDRRVRARRVSTRGASRRSVRDGVRRLSRMQRARLVHPLRHASALPHTRASALLPPPPRGAARSTTHPRRLWHDGRMLSLRSDAPPARRRVAAVCNVRMASESVRLCKLIQCSGGGRRSELAPLRSHAPPARRRVAAIFNVGMHGGRRQTSSQPSKMSQLVQA